MNKKSMIIILSAVLIVVLLGFVSYHVKGLLKPSYSSGIENSEFEDVVIDSSLGEEPEKVEVSDSEVVKPSETNLPTATSGPVATPKPNAVSEATPKPKPSATPEAIQTPAPSMTPVPTKKPEPENPAEAGTLDYETFQGLDPAEQEVHMKSFESIEAFFDWYNAAKEKYELENPPIIVDGGAIDLDKIIEENE